jgi:hypothetical protein
MSAGSQPIAGQRVGLCAGGREFTQGCALFGNTFHVASIDGTTEQVEAYVAIRWLARREVNEDRAGLAEVSFLIKSHGTRHQSADISRG